MDPLIERGRMIAHAGMFNVIYNLSCSRHRVENISITVFKPYEINSFNFSLKSISPLKNQRT